MSLKRKAEDTALSSKKPKQNGSITSFFGPPKTVSTSAMVTSTSIERDAPTSEAKFDKQKWVEKLTEEQKDLLKLEIETLHESWLAQLKNEVVSKEFLELKRFIKKELDAKKTVFPPQEDVYSWFVPFTFCIIKYD